MQPNNKPTTVPTTYRLCNPRRNQACNQACNQAPNHLNNLRPFTMPANITTIAQIHPPANSGALATNNTAVYNFFITIAQPNYFSTCQQLSPPSSFSIYWPTFNPRTQLPPQPSHIPSFKQPSKQTFSRLNSINSTSIIAHRSSINPTNESSHQNRLISYQITYGQST